MRQCAPQQILFQMLLFIAAQFVCTASVYSSCNGTSESWYPPENLKEKFRTIQNKKKHCQHFKTKRNIANISKQKETLPTFQNKNQTTQAQRSWRKCMALRANAHADDGRGLPLMALLAVVGRILEPFANTLHYITLHYSSTVQRALQCHTSPSSTAAVALDRARDAPYTCLPCSMNNTLSASSPSSTRPLGGDGEESASSKPDLITPPPPEERRRDLASSWTRNAAG
jgi:hypothetical protein